ncbi:site-specific integrase [Roseospira marina]|uniref:Site-specific integrase n=1 Tax=Roseospira marina TaxID=140057 RepID=A0A5M6I6S1_9PROT|nr:site-specific integrase [Roseospira marina]KAA5603961.1 site-specific integrase [Roseospira marina]MBB4315931.1 integrase [Roseospira marina]MBB5089108.1 integrase [Roseospira marina]
MAGKLSARRIATLKEPGSYADGDGLYLKITKDGGRNWVFRYQMDKRRREMGLGRLVDVSLAEARDLLTEARRHVREGRDPIDVRNAARAANATPAAGSGPTLRAFAADLIAAKAPAWRNPKHAAQWSATLETYAWPTIGDRPLDSVTTEDVLAILRPIWAEKTETAKRVRGRLETVLDAARAMGLRTGENPARWKGHLDQILPAPSRVSAVEHSPALPYAAMPAFWRRLRMTDGLGAKALQFAILTAARTGEVLGATWDEVGDGAAGLGPDGPDPMAPLRWDRVDATRLVWTIPAARMKAAKEHRVPLSAPAVELLRDLEAARVVHGGGSPLVFPGQRKGRPLSNMAMLAVTRRMEVPAVPHGFRSTFRDWAGEVAGAPHEICEAALAHTKADKVVAAYQRGDFFERRRALMDAWAAFLAGG